MGTVAEVGSGVTLLKKGDRVVMPFNVADGRCQNCEEGNTAFCTGVNPGFAGGAYGYVAMGKFNGGQVPPSHQLLSAMFHSYLDLGTIRPCSLRRFQRPYLTSWYCPRSLLRPASRYIPHRVARSYSFQIFARGVCRSIRGRPCRLDGRV